MTNNDDKYEISIYLLYSVVDKLSVFFYKA
jgi:hypothetical protein